MEHPLKMRHFERERKRWTAHTWIMETEIFSGTSLNRRRSPEDLTVQFKITYTEIRMPFCYITTC